MNDLLTLHADRVGASNATHNMALHAAKDAAHEALRAEIAAFGEKLAKAQVDIADACQALLTKLDGIAVKSSEEFGAAFGANLAEIAASGAAMEAEMRQRAAFLMTGKLPVEDPLPEAPALAEAAE